MAAALNHAGISLAHHTFFDTITLVTGERTDELYKKAQDAGFNLRKLDGKLGISFDETTKVEEANALLKALTGKDDISAFSDAVEADEFAAIPASCRRTSGFLTHPVFRSYHSETLMMRYLKKLENKDFSLTHGMIVGKLYHEAQCSSRNDPCHLAGVRCPSPICTGGASSRLFRIGQAA